MIIPNHNYTARERTVCDLLAPLTNVDRMLNIGMRHPGDPRNLWWINICKINGTETYVLEVFEPNCRDLRAAGVENVTRGDVRDARKLYDMPFDVILWWHGPEQIESAEAPTVVDDLWQLTAGTLILGCPLGDERQGICYGNPHERQRSFWQPEDLAALGFQTTVVRDGQPFPHITAWRSRDGIAAHGLNTDETLTAKASGESAEETRTEGTRGWGVGERGEAAWTGTIAKCELQNANCKLTDQQRATDNAVADVSSASSFIPHPRQVGISPQAQPSPLRASFKTAIIFDDRTRPETTGIYCRKALQSLVDVEYFHPDDVANIPSTGFDLFILIDDGLDYALPAELRPVAYWAIDTHIDFDRCLRHANQVDFVFAAQKDGAERLRQAGVATTQWLPLACDPEIHGWQNVAKERDLCFVGNVFPGPRADLLRLLQQYFIDIHIGNAYFEDMARIYSATRIIFNRSLGNDVNMRVYEALASGSLLMTNDLTENGQHELFRDGVHLATYRTGEELLDKLRYYLRRDDLRERIAAAGRAEVLAKHTYVHRMRQLLVVVAGRPGEGGPPVGPAGDGITENLHRPRADSVLAHLGGEHSFLDAQSPTRSAQRLFPNAQGQLTNAQRQLTNSNPQSAIRNPKSAHDPSYFDFDRPELLALIASTAAMVLEVGCGRGRLGASLKARQPCEVIGIELDEHAAAIASGTLDQVFTGDMERIELHFEAECFDAVVCGDVLEHFRDPAQQLARIRRWLKPGGVVVASIPNVRHHSVVRSLLDGNWTYEPAGLLDETHLHFFTRRNIQELFEKAGYTITAWAAVPGPGYDEWVQQGRPLSIDLGRTQLNGLPEQEAEEFFIYQWLVVGKAVEKAKESEVRSQESEARQQASDITASPCPPLIASSAIPSAPDPLIPSSCLSPPSSLILHPSSLPSCLLLMVTYNRLEYTKLALESVLALDYPNLMIVVWDNASTDGTVDYVQERLRGESRARLVASPVNRGVVHPMNAVWWTDHGAEFLAKIDNDTWVPPDLLRRLAECHERSKRFGVLSGFHFREEGEAMADESRVQVFDGVRVLAQPYVGGCAVMVRRAVLGRLGQIPCRPEGQQSPFMDSGWTFYQQKMTDEGLVNGYPWPPIHVDHMEDTRSSRCVRTDEHQAYKQALRGMSLEQFTQALCVWRPIWEAAEAGTRGGRDGETRRPDDVEHGDASIAKCEMKNEKCKLEESQSLTPNAQRLFFTQDFHRDFDQFDFFGPPFAFSRFADGERAICMGKSIQGADGWTYSGGSSQFREALLAALRFNAPDYYLGLSDGCCDPVAKHWYLEQISVPLSQVTFSNIFVNGNYDRFRQLDLSGAVIVASQGGDYWIPDDAMNTNFDINGLVERLLHVDRTILVSAGPVSCVIIHRYWQRATPQKRQVIVDVGSAIDEWTKGRKTRQYQTPGTKNSELVCTW